MTLSKSVIQQAFKSGNPVIRGNRAIFIWEGDSAPRLTGDLNDWDDKPRRFRRVPPRLVPDSGEPIWSCTLTVPRDAYVEYALYDPETQKTFPDPFNPKSVSSGFDSLNNYFYMPGARPSPLMKRRAEVPRGKLTSHRVDTKWLREGSARRIYLYHPPVRERVPLLVVYDGQDYLRRGRLNVIVDNLIAQGRIQPIAMAFVSNGGRWRDVEYSCSDGTLLWLDQTILPLAGKELRLLDIEKQPGTYGVLGASLGGTMSMYTGLRMPDVFGKMLIQAGAFMIESRAFAVVDLVRHGQARDVNIWMDSGRLDSLLDDNRRMLSLLKDKGYHVTYREYSGGHNYTAWRDNISHGLEAMFPP